MKRKQYILTGLIVVAIVGSILVVRNLNSNDMSLQTMSLHSSNGGSSTEIKGMPNEVVIQNFAFNSKKISIKKGTTITWTNRDAAHHDITPDMPSDKFKASELLAKGESYKVTFSETGSFSYHCSPHPYMKGVIEVTE